MREGQPQDPRAMGIETGADDQKENILERGAGSVAKMLESFDEEGKHVLANLFAKIDKVVGREHHPEWLRKILLEQPKPYDGSLATYEYNSSHMQQVLVELQVGCELAYGALSLTARTALKGLLEQASRLLGDLSKLAAGATEKLSSAEKLYGTKEK